MTRQIRYDFAFKDRPSWNYVIAFDDHDRCIPASNREVKTWTRLEFNQCPHCPLKSSEHPQCPIARNLDQVVDDSKDTISCTEATVTVTTAERTYEKKCATQEGVRSLFGAVMASSGCPHLDWLKPLAHFHLPFADINETLFRVLSLQLVRQFLFEPKSSFSECSENIQTRYEAVQRVNQSFIKRIQSYCKADADKNAIITLDAFAKLFEFQQEGDFKSLRKIYE